METATAMTMPMIRDCSNHRSQAPLPQLLLLQYKMAGKVTINQNNETQVHRKSVRLLVGLLLRLLKLPRPYKCTLLHLLLLPHLLILRLRLLLILLLSSDSATDSYYHSEYYSYSCYYYNPYCYSYAYTYSYSDSDYHCYSYS